MKRRLMALVALVALIVLAVWAEFAFAVVPFKRHDVAVPAVGASPQQVVAAYVEALDAHDCDTAKAVWLSDREEPRMWCSDVARARIVGPEKGFQESTARADVSLTLDVRWRLLKNDGSIADDPFPWSFVLTQDPRGTWRIVDNGLG